ncbi:hypothetical protein Tco_1290284 [Tanacetum coccineum]
MPPRMTTRSACRSTAAPRGGRTGGRTGRGSGRTRGRTDDQASGGIDEQGGQVGGQGNEVNDGVDGVPDFSTIIVQQLQNLLPTIGCSIRYRKSKNHKKTVKTGQTRTQEQKSMQKAGMKLSKSNPSHLSINPSQTLKDKIPKLQFSPS